MSRTNLRIYLMATGVMCLGTGVCLAVPTLLRLHSVTCLTVATAAILGGLAAIWGASHT